jgi:putative aldouronate transport system substrate-binding protein
MPNVKKVVCLVIVMCFVLSVVFTGCGNKTDSSTAANTTTVTESTVDKDVQPAKEPVTLKWRFPFNVQTGQEEVFAEAGKILKEKINTNVEFLAMDWGTYGDKMNVLINSGDPFDICWSSCWASDYFGNAAKGAFKELDSMLDKHAPKLKASMPAELWDAVRVNGKAYGVISYQTAVMAKGFWVKKDLADKYALDPSTIKSYKDIEPFLQKVMDGEKGMYPIRIIDKGCWGDINVSLGLEELKGPGIYLRVNDTNLEPVNIHETLEFKEYLDVMRSWYKKGFIRKDAATVSEDNAEQKAGKYAVGFEGTIKPGGDIEKSTALGFQVIEIPIGSNLVTTGAATGTVNCISNTSANPERALEFLEFMNDPVTSEVFNMLCYGIENKHYKKVGDKRIEPIKDSGYEPNGQWLYASTFNAYLMPGQPDDVWEKTKQMNETATKSASMGFTFNSDPVKAECAALETAFDEYMAGLGTGTVDPAKKLQEYIEKEKNAGVQKVIDEIKKQIVDWKAKNNK